MNNGIVAKFGGSSVKDGQAMLRCSNIIENNPNIVITIISATYNTTNQLETVSRFAQFSDDENLEHILKDIEDKHLKIAEELFCSNEVLSDLKLLFSEMRMLAIEIKSLKSCSPKNMDHLYSLGERMSSLIFSDLLKLRLPDRNVIFLDARRVIKTDSQFKMATPDIDLISECASSELKPFLKDKKNIIVTQGFIGSDINGVTTTLGREGSDYSASLFAECIDASLVQIWTDVEGVKSSDPRLVENTRSIEKLTYDQATALAGLGAKVLFPRTILPAQRKNIPVFVGSSLNPNGLSTIIEKSIEERFLLKAVTVMTSNNEDYLSFVGSDFDKNKDLIENLSTRLNVNGEHFIFSDKTNVSITFKIFGIDKTESLKWGHQILCAFSVN